MDRPVGRGLTLNDYSRGRRLTQHDSSILASPGQVRGSTKKNHNQNQRMNASIPYDLIIGLDRSDQKADLCLIEARTGQRRSVVIDTAPEALWEWLAP